MTDFFEAVSEVAIGVIDSLLKVTKHSRALADSVGVTDARATKTQHPRAFSDTIAITNTIHIGLKLNFVDTVGIVDNLRKRPISGPAGSMGLTGALTVSGVFVQFDTWRPVTSPDNGLVLVCRTPLGEHDSYTGQTHLALWTIMSDGTHERPAVLRPADNGYGWTSYAHPEWSPSGDDVVVAAETSTTYELVVLDATGFGS